MSDFDVLCDSHKKDRKVGGGVVEEVYTCLGASESAAGLERRLLEGPLSPEPGRVFQQDWGQG